MKRNYETIIVALYPDIQDNNFQINLPKRP